MRYELTGIAELIGLTVAIPLIYFGLGTVSRWMSLQADRWDDDGVIRGFPKLWKDESPKRFAAILSYYRFNAIFWWAVARFLPVLLGLVIFVKILIIAFNSVLTRS